jgi:hypothetical protein
MRLHQQSLNADVPHHHIRLQPPLLSRDVTQTSLLGKQRHVEPWQKIKRYMQRDHML